LSLLLPLVTLSPSSSAAAAKKAVTMLCPIAVNLVVGVVVPEDHHHDDDEEQRLLAVVVVVVVVAVVLKNDRQRHEYIRHLELLELSLFRHRQVESFELQTHGTNGSIVVQDRDVASKVVLTIHRNSSCV